MATNKKLEKDFLTLGIKKIPINVKDDNNACFIRENI